MSNAGAHVDDGAGGEAHVAVDEQPVVLVFGLQLAGKATCGGLEGAVKGDLGRKFMI